MRTTLLFTILIASTIATGCSSFNRDFNEAADQPLPKIDITGPWTGTWTSTKSGHNGKLRCLVTPLETENEYEARFHATYAGFLTFEYTITLITEQKPDAMHFNAEQDIGALAGGVYQYKGTITPDVFKADYTSKGDYGVFDMVRPVEEQAKDEQSSTATNESE